MAGPSVQLSVLLVGDWRRVLRLFAVPFIVLSMFTSSPSVANQPSPSPEQTPIAWEAGNAAVARIAVYIKTVREANEKKFLIALAEYQESQKVQSAQTVVNADTPTTPDEFLACTRAHESDSAGGYGAVSPGGTYRGAYQFDQTTWDSTAATAGRPDLVGADPAATSSADQDSLASALYAARGNQPWGGRC